jgi:integrase
VTGPSPRRPPRLLEKLREELAVRHCARRTAGTYEQWVRRFLRFHGLKPPREMGQVEGTTALVARLLYGSGLRLMEALHLRVQDLDFGHRQITVRGGKGDKDRLTLMPERLIAPLERHLEAVR